MSHKKIKVMPTTGTRQEWDTIVAHARKLGAISRDGEYGYNPDRTAMIIDNHYMKYSSPTMKPKAGVEVPTKVSVDEFMSLESLHDVQFIGKPVDKQAVAKAVAATRAIMPCSQNTLAVSDCTVLVQNDVLWASVGLPMLKDLGVEVTTLGDKDYIIDVANNDAQLFTAETASAQAKKDLLDGKVTPYTQWAKQCELIENLVMSKELPEQD